MSRLPVYALAVLPLPADFEEKYRARMIERGETPLPADDEDPEAWRCDWCRADYESPDVCADDCDCPACSSSRALDDDADMWADR